MFCFPLQCSPCLRPPGFRKWSIIFLLRRHKPAPLQLLNASHFCVYRHLSSKGLIQPTPVLHILFFIQWIHLKSTFFTLTHNAFFKFVCETLVGPSKMCCEIIVFLQKRIFYLIACCPVYSPQKTNKYTPEIKTCGRDLSLYSCFCTHLNYMYSWNPARN